MLTENNLNGIRGSLAAVEMPGCSVSGRIAFGIEENLVPGRYAWVVVNIENRRITSADLVFLPVDAEVEDEVHAEVAIRTSVAIWRTMATGGHAEVVRAAEAFTLSVSGRLPYFIRHLPSILKLVVIFSRAIPAPEVDDPAPTI